MRKYIFNAAIILVVLTLLLSACSLPASKAPAATPTAGSASASQESLLKTLVSSTRTVTSGTPKALAETPEGEATAEPTAQPTSQATAQATVPSSINTRPAPVTATPGGAQPTAAATQAATLAVVVPTPVRPNSYALQPAEFPFCIARRFNLDIDSFFSLNGLTMTSRLPAGSILQIPQTGVWAASLGPRALHAHPTTHTVAAGETIYSIACYYGDVDPNAIVLVNNLTSPFSLTGGQKLNIP